MDPKQNKDYGCGAWSGKRASIFSQHEFHSQTLDADAPSSSTSMARDRTNTDAMRYRTRSR